MESESKSSDTKPDRPGRSKSPFTPDLRTPDDDLTQSSERIDSISGLASGSGMISPRLSPRGGRPLSPQFRSRTRSPHTPVGDRRSSSLTPPRQNSESSELDYNPLSSFLTPRDFTEEIGKIKQMINNASDSQEDHSLHEQDINPGMSVKGLFDGKEAVRMLDVATQTPDVEDESELQAKNRYLEQQKRDLEKILTNLEASNADLSKQRTKAEDEADRLRVEFARRFAVFKEVEKDLTRAHDANANLIKTHTDATNKTRDEIEELQRLVEKLRKLWENEQTLLVNSEIRCAELSKQAEALRQTNKGLLEGLKMHETAAEDSKRLFASISQAREHQVKQDLEQLMLYDTFEQQLAARPRPVSNSTAVTTYENQNLGELIQSITKSHRGSLITLAGTPISALMSLTGLSGYTLSPGDVGSLLQQNMSMIKPILRTRLRAKTLHAFLPDRRAGDAVVRFALPNTHHRENTTQNQLSIESGSPVDDTDTESHRTAPEFPEARDSRRAISRRASTPRSFKPWSASSTPDSDDFDAGLPTRDPTSAATNLDSGEEATSSGVAYHGKSNARRRSSQYVISPTSFQTQKHETSSEPPSSSVVRGRLKGGHVSTQDFDDKAQQHDNPSSPRSTAIPKPFEFSTVRSLAIPPSTPASTSELLSHRDNPEYPERSRRPSLVSKISNPLGKVHPTSPPMAQVDSSRSEEEVASQPNDQKRYDFTTKADPINRNKLPKSTDRCAETAKKKADEDHQKGSTVSPEATPEEPKSWTSMFDRPLQMYRSYFTNYNTSLNTVYNTHNNDNRTDNSSTTNNANAYYTHYTQSAAPVTEQRDDQPAVPIFEQRSPDFWTWAVNGSILAICFLLMASVLGYLPTKGHPAFGYGGEKLPSLGGYVGEKPKAITSNPEAMIVMDPVVAKDVHSVLPWIGRSHGETVYSTVTESVHFFTVESSTAEPVTETLWTTVVEMQSETTTYTETERIVVPAVRNHTVTLTETETEVQHETVIVPKMQYETSIYTTTEQITVPVVESHTVTLTETETDCTSFTEVQHETSIYTTTEQITVPVVENHTSTVTETQLVSLTELQQETTTVSKIQHETSTYTETEEITVVETQQVTITDTDTHSETATLTLTQKNPIVVTEHHVTTITLTKTEQVVISQIQYEPTTVTEECSPIAPTSTCPSCTRCTSCEDPPPCSDPTTATTPTTPSDPTSDLPLPPTPPSPLSPDGHGHGEGDSDSSSDREASPLRVRAMNIQSLKSITSNLMGTYRQVKSPVAWIFGYLSPAIKGSGQINSAETMTKAKTEIKTKTMTKAKTKTETEAKTDESRTELLPRPSPSQPSPPSSDKLNVSVSVAPPSPNPSLSTPIPIQVHEQVQVQTPVEVPIPVEEQAPVEVQAQDHQPRPSTPSTPFSSSSSSPITAKYHQPTNTKTNNHNHNHNQHQHHNQNLPQHQPNRTLSEEIPSARAVRIPDRYLDVGPAHLGLAPWLRRFWDGIVFDLEGLLG